MRRAKVVSALLLWVFFAVISPGAIKKEWLTGVPAKERVRANPVAGNEEAVAAGAILYRRSCASCHGDDAQGLGRHPNLRTERVRQTTDGELHWLLTNGQLAAGMPSWSRLPDVQRWQLARYLHSLDPEGGR